MSEFSIPIKMTIWFSNLTRFLLQANNMCPTGFLLRSVFVITVAFVMKPIRDFFCYQLICCGTLKGTTGPDLGINDLGEIIKFLSLCLRVFCPYFVACAPLAQWDGDNEWLNFLKGYDDTCVDLRCLHARFKVTLICYAKTVSAVGCCCLTNSCPLACAGWLQRCNMSLISMAECSNLYNIFMQIWNKVYVTITCSLGTECSVM